MPQKWRKTSEIVSFGCPVSLKREIDAEVARQKVQSRGAALNRSTWILRAIQRDLDHAKRSRRRKLSATQLEAERANPRNEADGLPAEARAGSVHLPLDEGQPATPGSVEADQFNADVATDLGRRVVDPVLFPFPEVGQAVGLATALRRADPAPASAAGAPGDTGR